MELNLDSRSSQLPTSRPWREASENGWSESRELDRGHPIAQFLLQPFDGETDDVGVGTGNLFHQQIAIFLNRIGAGFIEWIHFGEIAADFNRVERTERHHRGFGENFLAMLTEVQHAN